MSLCFGLGSDLHNLCNMPILPEFLKSEEAQSGPVSPVHYLIVI